MRFITCLILPALLVISSCKPLPVTSSNVAPVNIPGDSITFAVIGDYGRDTPQEDSVAKMVLGWKPDFIITVGDNNYPLGQSSTISAHIGKYYCDYIYNPDAPADQQCNGKAAQAKFNLFYPSPGNHDNYSAHAKPYLNYFTLPGDENNYDFTWGPVHFYSINSGTHGTSTRKDWLSKALVQDKSTFKFVYFHHPPYSGGWHGSAKGMQWPYHEWGVDAVLAGHEHFYARATDNQEKTPIYFICGSSGTDEHYSCDAHPLDANRFQFLCDNIHFGAMKVTVVKKKAVFEYYAVEIPDKPWDTYTINKQ